MRFACRMCRKEVTQDSEGTFNHVHDGSPACIVTLADGTPLPDWDRHEKMEGEFPTNYVPSLEEVLKAGYSEEAAKAIIAREEELANTSVVTEEVNLKKEGGE